MPDPTPALSPAAQAEFDKRQAAMFAAANVCAHPRTGHIARHHLHEHSLQRQFKEAVRRAHIPK